MTSAHCLQAATTLPARFDVFPSQSLDGSYQSLGDIIHSLLQFLADRTSARSMIGHWHETVVFRLSLSLTLCLPVTMFIVVLRVGVWG